MNIYQYAYYNLHAFTEKKGQIQRNSDVYKIPTFDRKNRIEDKVNLADFIERNLSVFLNYVIIFVAIANEHLFTYKKLTNLSWQTEWNVKISNIFLCKTSIKDTHLKVFRLTSWSKLVIMRQAKRLVTFLEFLVDLTAD